MPESNDLSEQIAAREARRAEILASMDEHDEVLETPPAETPAEAEAVAEEPAAEVAVPVETPAVEAEAASTQEEPPKINPTPETNASKKISNSEQITRLIQKDLDNASLASLELVKKEALLILETNPNAQDSAALNDFIEEVEDKIKNFKRNKKIILEVEARIAEPISGYSPKKLKKELQWLRDKTGSSEIIKLFPELKRRIELRILQVVEAQNAAIPPVAPVGPDAVPVDSTSEEADTETEPDESAAERPKSADEISVLISKALEELKKPIGEYSNDGLREHLVWLQNHEYSFAHLIYISKTPDNSPLSAISAMFRRHLATQEALGVAPTEGRTGSGFQKKLESDLLSEGFDFSKLEKMDREKLRETASSLFPILVLVINRISLNSTYGEDSSEQPELMALVRDYWIKLENLLATKETNAEAEVPTTETTESTEEQSEQVTGTTEKTVPPVTQGETPNPVKWEDWETSTQAGGWTPEKEQRLRDLVARLRVNTHAIDEAEARINEIDIILGETPEGSGEIDISSMPEETDSEIEKKMSRITKEIETLDKKREEKAGEYEKIIFNIVKRIILAREIKELDTKIAKNHENYNQLHAKFMAILDQKWQKQSEEHRREQAERRIDWEEKIRTDDEKNSR